MSALNIRDIPECDVEVLKRRASRNRRSLNGEMLYIINWVSSLGESFELPERPASPNQKDTILRLFGKWKDSRTTDEIIHDIESSRTKGREIRL